MNNEYNVEHLLSIINESIQVSDKKGNCIDLVLKEVRRDKLDGDLWEAFTAIYEGPPRQIPQGTFTFSHKSFGQIDLFVSPNSETEYETVFSRRRQVSDSNV